MPREIAVPSSTGPIKGRNQHYSATTIRALLISSLSLQTYSNLEWAKTIFSPCIYWGQTWCLYWHRAWHGICEDEPWACVLQLHWTREISARIGKNLLPLSFCFHTNKARGKTPFICFSFATCRHNFTLLACTHEVPSQGWGPARLHEQILWCGFWYKRRKIQVTIHGWHFGFLFQ